MRNHLLSIIYYPSSIICVSRSSGRGYARVRNRGFTLIELLVVVAVIGILATITTGAAQYAIKSARQRRMAISCRVLETAIIRYRTEYGDWPGSYSGTSATHTYKGKDNASVFGPLRVDSDSNVDKIRFIDETAFYTEGTSKKMRPLAQTTGNKPLVFQSRDGKAVDSNGNFFYFKVEINYEDETVSVSCPKFNDEEDDD